MDITMCMSIECPRRFNCYRFIAIPDPVQSYADFLSDNTEQCFVKATKEEKERYEQSARSNG